MVTIGGTRYWENSFRILEGMLKGPHDFEVLKLLIISRTSSGVHRWIAMDNGLGLVRYSLKAFLGGGIFASTEDPILVKNLFITEAISLFEVTNLPS